MRVKKECLRESGEKMRSAVSVVRKAPRLRRRMWIMEGDLWQLPTLPALARAQLAAGLPWNFVSHFTCNRPRTMNMDYGSDEVIIDQHATVHLALLAAH